MVQWLRWAAALLAAIVAAAWAVSDEPKEKRREQPPVKLGEKAPDFALPDSTGTIRRLSDFQGKKHVALVFYPAQFKAGG